MSSRNLSTVELETCTEKMQALGIATDQEVNLPGGGYVCGSWMIVNPATKTARPMLCKRRTCKDCRKFMAKRYAKQIEYECMLAGMDAQVIEIKDSEWQATHKRLQRHGARYKSFPMAGRMRRVIVIGGDLADLDGDELTRDQGELIKQLDRWITESDLDKRITGSRKFGGSWHGAHARNAGRVWKRKNVTRKQFERDIREHAKEKREQAADTVTRAQMLELSIDRPMQDAQGYTYNMIAMPDDDFNAFWGQYENG